MIRQLRYYGGMFIRGRIRRDARQFVGLLGDCRTTQRQTLARIMELNAESFYSRRRGLTGSMSVDQFRKSLPISDFETVRDEIEQLKEGNFQSLLGPRNKLLMFALSSGTTSQAKYIPITSQFLSDYRRGWQVWGINAMDSHPSLHMSDIVQLGSNHDQYRTSSGTPCGNISGLVGTMQSRVVQTMYAVPNPVGQIADSASKGYTALRCSYANSHVGLVMTANPSTLIQLSKTANLHMEQLIRDIADGTLSTNFDIDPAIRAQLKGRIGRPDKERARELELIAARTGAIMPRDVWPKLKLVAVWTGGSVGSYLSPMRKFFGDVPIRDHGLSASEGRMTIPLADSTAAGVLDVGSHFFEFIPEEEHESPDPTVLEAHELQAGKNYFILLTTVSGLYRYDIRDVVRCTGFMGTTPLLEFLHKGAHIASVTGEKLAESQVVSAIRTGLDQLRLEVQHYTLSPVWDDPPKYRLHIERGCIPVPELRQRLAATVDAELQELNVEYKEKRQSSRLGLLECLAVPNGTWERFIKHRQSRFGASLEQYKHPCLVPQLTFSDMLVNDFAPSAERDTRAA
ncbi:MAG: GH3 auxin-responsive promoter family protein [Planctomycetes bacterium]|nr:GH3 auxin-responsive promoter family protein [Planctomycetota bacterium]